MEDMEALVQVAEKQLKKHRDKIMWKVQVKREGPESTRAKEVTLTATEEKPLMKCGTWLPAGWHHTPGVAIGFKMMDMANKPEAKDITINLSDIIGNLPTSLIHNQETTVMRPTRV